MVRSMDDQPQPHAEEAAEITPREREMIAEGLDDVAAGRLVRWRQIEAWIDSLATDRKLPPPYSS